MVCMVRNREEMLQIQVVAALGMTLLDEETCIEMSLTQHDFVISNFNK